MFSLSLMRIIQKSPFKTPALARMAQHFPLYQVRTKPAQIAKCSKEQKIQTPSW